MKAKYSISNDLYLAMKDIGIRAGVSQQLKHQQITVL